MATAQTCKESHNSSRSIFGKVNKTSSKFVNAMLFMDKGHDKPQSDTYYVNTQKHLAHNQTTIIVPAPTEIGKNGQECFITGFKLYQWTMSLHLNPTRILVTL